MTKTNITFLDQIIPNSMFIFTNSKSNILDKYDTNEINQFLSLLDNNVCYVITLEFIYHLITHDSEGPSILLSKPILITKNSSSIVLSEFIKEKMDDVTDTFFLDDSLLNDKNPETALVLIKYSTINLF